MKILKIAAYITVFCATSIYGISIVKGINIIKSRFNTTGSTVSVAEPVTGNPAAFESILQPASVSLSPAESFDPSGDYYITTDGSSSVFADVRITITARDYSYENGVYSNNPIVPSGMLFDGKEFALAKIAVGEREITFETETVGGIRYQFVGHFPVSPETSCVNCEYPPDLTGVLRKIKEGKVLDAATVDFYVAGC